LGFPHAQQAVRITRTRVSKGKTTRETAYLIASLPAEQAQPADLADWARREWHIENRVHYIRDVTPARTPTRPAPATAPPCSPHSATPRSATTHQRRNDIARATRRAAHRPGDLIDAVTRSYPTTQ